MYVYEFKYRNPENHRIPYNPKAECSQILQTQRYEECLFITEFNKPACLYALRQAQAYANSKDEQLLWIVASDQPPVEYFGDYSSEELEKLKRKWLNPTYHAKKTEGIPSLMPGVYGMPVRLTTGKAKFASEYGLHNGARGGLRGWELHPDDLASLSTNASNEVILTHLP